MNSKYKPIDHNKMSSLMESGRGKQKDRLQLKAVPTVSDPTFNPEKVFSKMRDGEKWKNTELAAVTGIDRKTIGKLREGKYYNGKTIGSNSGTIETIAEALDVDPEYLTGEQSAKRKKKLTTEDLKRIQKNQEDRIKGRKFRILADFMKLYSLNVKYEYDECDSNVNPKHYWLWDADGELIRDGNDISDLDPLVDIVMNYLKTGSDILSLFFDDMWIDEL